MNQFKIGDKVTPVRVDGYQDDMKSLLGKTLTVIEVYPSTGCPTVCAGSPGTISRFWFANDLQRVSDGEPSGGDDSTKVPAAAHSEQFKIGDHVVLIGGPDKSDEVHVVTGSYNPTHPLRAGSWTYTVDGRLLSSSGVCMRHATADEIAAQQKPKPIQRGDLVEFRGDIWVVIDTYSDGDCWVGSITGGAKTRCHAANEMTRVGSIRKKVERLKREKKA